jgi:hypothetical protein
MKRIVICTSLVAVTLLLFSLVAVAQRPGPSGDPTRRAASGAASDLTNQIGELRAAIARLESIIAARLPQGSVAPAASGGMQGMSGMPGGMMGRRSGAAGGMGGMRGGMMGGGMQGGMMDDMGEMGSMQTAAAGGMAAMEGMDAAEMSMEMGMMGMSPMGQQGGSALQVSSLPGFPGASHIYHIGATGFFLDHPDHISLDTTQQQELNRLKQGALLAKASTQRKINEAEQQLWELTAADQPDAEQVKAKVEEIANLRGQQRLDFIRAVGEAAQVLADDQRQILLGLMQPAEKPLKTDPHQGHSPPSK